MRVLGHRVRVLNDLMVEHFELIFNVYKLLHFGGEVCFKLVCHTLATFISIHFLPLLLGSINRLFSFVIDKSRKLFSVECPDRLFLGIFFFKS
jgi:hypothetical protein